MPTQDTTPMGKLSMTEIKALFKSFIRLYEASRLVIEQAAPIGSGQCLVTVRTVTDLDTAYDKVTSELFAVLGHKESL